MTSAPVTFSGSPNSNANPARLLAFDTSTESLAVALHDGARCWPLQEPGGAMASARLLPCIEALLAQAGRGYDTLDAIAFGAGPGAFTGLRTSCAVAQGLGFGAGLPVIAVDSLLIVAEDARLQLGAQLGDQWFDRHNETDHSLDVAVAMDARMDEIYAAIYRWTGGQWHTVQAPALYTLPALAAAWQQPPMPLDVKLLAGSALRAFGPRLLLPPWPALQRVEQETQRAVALMNVAQQLWRLGHAQDAAHALPLYLRDKVAQTTTEREAARAAKAAL